MPAIRVICFTILLSAFSFRAAAEDFTNAILAYLQQRVHAEIPNGCIVVGIVDEHGSRVVGCGKLDNGTDQEVNGNTLFAAVTQKWVLPKERPENAPVDSKVVLPKVP